jgi:hypothetical protein
MPGTPLNIFVVGLDDLHLAQLKTLPDAANYRFHPLFAYRELKQQDHFPVQELLHDGVARLKAFPDRVDAIVGYWDFPVSTVLPLLREAVGLPTTSLESVLKCEHKYWSRLAQYEVIPQHVPCFATVNPLAEDALARPPLDFPFWLKPVKSVLSHLGFRITDEADFHHAISQIRARIARYAVPFNLILAKAQLPPAIQKVNGYHCIAESMISRGRQCTVEGYCWNDEVVVYGVVDSLRESPEISSLSRYQYPSTLPLPVVERMAAICRQVMPHIGYVNSPFNVEFFWDEESDQIWLLEINPRISKSHAPLFYKVDGRYHHQIMLDLALGKRPEFPHRQGRFACAAKFMVRHYQDTLVTRTPSPGELSNLEAEYPSVIFAVAVKEGMQLSTLRDQDSYSYEVATLFIGGESTAELEAKYHDIVARLPFEFAPLPPDKPGTRHTD